MFHFIHSKPIGYAGHFSCIRLPCPFTQSFDSIQSHTALARPLLSFCQFLSFFLSRSRLSQPASIQARIPRDADRGAGRRIRVQPFLFDAALGTAGVKTCLYIATTIQHRTYKAAAQQRASLPDDISTRAGCIAAHLLTFERILHPSTTDRYLGPLTQTATSFVATTRFQCNTHIIRHPASQ